MFPDPTIRVSTRPISFVAADFNEDGRRDIAIAHALSSDLLILLATMQPATWTPVTISMPGASTSIATSDFNNDDRPDLAVTLGSLNQCIVLLNNGNATFVGASPIATGLRPTNVKLHDLNSDGFEDLIIANRDSDFVGVFYSDGNGEFTEQRGLSTGDGPSSLWVGDLNNDGIADIVAANRFSHDLSIFAGIPDGAFGTAMTLPVGFDPVDVLGADFNHDGIVDLATAIDGKNELFVLHGTGDFAFDTAVVFELNGSPRALWSSDINQDGFVDLAVTVSAVNNHVAILLGDENGLSASQTPATYRVGSAPFGLLFDDLDQDGESDLATINYNTDSLTILPRMPNGDFATTLSFFAENNPTSIAVSDLDSDGRLDLVTTNCLESFVSVLRSEKSEGFADAMAWPIGTDPPGAGTSPQDLVSADFNSDGNFDIAAVNEIDKSVGVIFGDGAGNFTPPVEVPIGGNGRELAAGDIDHDGDTDLIATTFSTIYLLRNDGAGSFQVLTEQFPATDGAILGVTFFDTNQDGIDDIVTLISSTQGSAGYVNVMLGDGSGQFTNVPPIEVKDAPVSLMTGDLNHDGVVDLVLLHCVPEGIGVALGNGKGGFSTVALHQQTGICASGCSVPQLAVADLNGDGNNDIAVASLANDSVMVFYGEGTGLFVETTEFNVGVWPQAVAAADFDADGDVDLVVTNFQSSTVTFLPSLLMDEKLQPDLNGDGCVNGADLSTLLATWGQTGPADLNGDGVINGADLAVLLASWSPDC